ncbi:MAG TPA: hypothetical protein VFL74_05315 [Sphingomicrobium sp.]|nr:hypothetical protein [Sphingomicrobium sp.]
MDVIRGGLLSGVATAALVGPMTAAERARGRYMRAPDGHGDGGSGGSDDLDDLLDAPGEAKPGEEKPGEEKPGEEKRGEEKPGEEKPGEIADWMKGYSAEAPGAGELSNQEWLAKIGAKDPDDLVGRYRQLEKAHRDSGRIKIPGEDAKPEEIKAFREAMGVPEKAEDYEIKLPDGLDSEKYEIDEHFLGPMREVALEHNVPAKAFNAFAEKFMRQQAEDIVAQAQANNTKRDEKVKEWGTDAPARKAEFKRGAEILGLDKSAILRMQSGFGVGETMDLLAKIGNLAGEDFFASGKASERFGVADLESAQKAVDAMTNDKDTAAKIRAKDPTVLPKYNRLIEAVAHFKEIESKK